MLGCTGNFQDQSADPETTSQDLYIHGYVSGRLFKKGKEAGDEGLPITVAATFLDGLVLSLTPFHNSCNYRSAVVFGYASLVEDADEALYAMKAITNNLIPERWEKSRTPPTKAELSSTSILRVRIESGTFASESGASFHVAFEFHTDAICYSFRKSQSRWTE
jgi:nitroimidazol reductase NimA-like FMN-containing flavoprotein (pyridoxamine 5'-phosphate oxidase superfamily)